MQKTLAIYGDENVKSALLRQLAVAPCGDENVKPALLRQLMVAPLPASLSVEKTFRIRFTEPGTLEAPEE